MIIISSLVQWLFEILSVFLSNFDVSIAMPYEHLSLFREYLEVASYFFPMSTVGAIVVVIMALSLYRIGIAVIKTIWAILPIL